MAANGAAGPRLRLLRTISGIVGLLCCAAAGGGIALTTPGCARVAEEKAEEAVNRLLPAYIGPADRYQTRIDGKSMGAVMRGRLRSVHVDGWGVRLDRDLTVDHLAADFADVVVDTKARKLKSVGSAAFTAQLGEANLDRYIRAQHPEIPGLGVSLAGDRLTVAARPEVFGVPTLPVSVQGHLLPRRGGKALSFEPDAAHLSIVPVPRPIVEWLVKRLDNTVDLSRVKVPLRVERASVTGGTLELSGSVPPAAIQDLAGDAQQR